MGLYVTARYCRFIIIIIIIIMVTLIMQMNEWWFYLHVIKNELKASLVLHTRELKEDNERTKT